VSAEHVSEVTDTIVAVSSSPGVAARGLVRVSGPAARQVLDAWIEPAAIVPRRMTRVRLRSPAIPAWCVLFASPRSYTGQDVVELQLPGNPALLERAVAQAAAAGGARLAEPGEFTFRAYLAGRLDLTQAEGVAATIAATSDAQLRAAELLRGGELGRLAQHLVESLATQLALVEAGIDFTDQEDVVPISPGTLDTNLAAIEHELVALLRRARPWKAIESLPWVVLAGEPSTGKSTLFNALLGRTRAVVSALPGTTRDVLVEPLQLPTAAGGACEVLLVDIAGLDDPRAAIDRDIQAAARDAITRAELILSINGHASPANADAPTIRVRTMADLGVPDAGEHDVAVSALTGQGMDHLRRLIAAKIGDRGVSLAGDLLALQPRHELALRAALGQLQQARGLLTPHRDATALPAPERLAAAMRSALDELASLGGAMTPDDVIGRIFATFCVGK
jgi:tRNA modification GTPase